MKYNFNKYRYLGAVQPDVPAPWNLHIFIMLTELDGIIRHKYMPLFLLNFISKFKPKPRITQIKQKFGTLKVVGTFTAEEQVFVTKAETICKDTCEYCGNHNTTHVMVKSWVRNLCATCKEQKKYGTNN